MNSRLKAAYTKFYQSNPGKYWLYVAFIFVIAPGSILLRLEGVHPLVTGVPGLVLILVIFPLIVVRKYGDGTLGISYKTIYYGLFKIFFWFALSSTTLLILVSMIVVNWAFVDWISFIAIYIGLLGLFGYAFNKRIWSGTVWQVMTFSIIFYWLVYSFYLDPKFGAYPPENFGDSMFTFLTLVPIFIANILYTIKISSKKV